MTKEMLAFTILTALMSFPNTFKTPTALTATIKLDSSHDADGCSIRKFSGILSRQLLDLSDCFKLTLALFSVPSCPPSTIVTQEGATASPLTSASIATEGTGGLSTYSAEGCIDHNVSCSNPFDHNGKRVKTLWCAWCREGGILNTGKWTRYYCSACDKPYCCLTNSNVGRECFQHTWKRLGAPAQEALITMVFAGTRRLLICTWIQEYQLLLQHLAMLINLIQLR